MRTIIILGVMAVVLFGLAAGASIFLTNYFDHKNKTDHNEAAEAKDTAKEKDLPPIARSGDSGPRSHPSSSNPETEQLVQELAKLRERQDAVGQRERQLFQRQQALQLIMDDIKSERAEIDKVRKELSEQTKGAGDEMASVERRAAELDEKKRETDQLLKDAKRGIYEADTQRSKNAKQVGGVLDTAEPADVAAIFENMVESGDLMTAVQILANMKDRRAAQVLSAFRDKAMAAQIAERMVGLKQTPAPGGVTPAGGKSRPATGDGSSR
jgi:hypothetical protein